MSNTLDTEQAVRSRYSAAAVQREVELCCPVDYDARYLKVIPQEVIDRDYGCGDPSNWVRGGETVLDLGSGGGKICFIASQVVGAEGRVIGVDMNDTMLQLARLSQSEVAAAIGYDNIRFCKGKIQDLAIDRDAIDAYLVENTVTCEADLQRLESFVASMRAERPMIADNSIDVVVSNCVLNLVDAAEKEKLFDEIFRVIRPGGRAVISDIVCDQPVPIEMQKDAELWSGCISGAFQEHEFIDAFVRAGFHGIEMPVLQKQPWQTVNGIEFRSATVIAYKGLPDNDQAAQNDAVIYRGPYQHVIDDHGNCFDRGIRIPVNRSTLERMISAPYVEDFIGMAAIDAPSNDPTEIPSTPKKKPASLNIVSDDGCGSQGCC